MKEKKNVVTYYLHWKFDEDLVVIENKDFDRHISSMMEGKVNLNIVLIDEFGVSNSKIDDIANQFIKDCQNRNGDRFCPYLFSDTDYHNFPACFRIFLANLFRALRNESYEYDFEVFVKRTTGDYFRVSIPATYVPEAKFKEFLIMGPDGLFAQFHPEIIFDYVLPKFYLYMFDTDRLGSDVKEANLLNYNIGAA